MIKLVQNNSLDYFSISKKFMLLSIILFLLSIFFDIINLFYISLVLFIIIITIINLSITITCNLWKRKGQINKTLRNTLIIYIIYLICCILLWHNVTNYYVNLFYIVYMLIIAYLTIIIVKPTKPKSKTNN